MAVLDIITLPDPLLRSTSAPVERLDADVQKLLDDMLETMYDAPGIGLAAVQVAVPRRMVVIDVGKPDPASASVGISEASSPNATPALGEPSEATRAPAPKRVPDPLFLINPQIVHRSTAFSPYEEGCLSLPDVLVDIERPAAVTLTYTDREGQPQTLEADGLLATAIQHEMDHLDGKLIIDFLSRLKRDMVVRKFRKSARSA
ncbi:MAG: peptide deformylase [Pseudomonadota bacterium]